MGCLHEALKIVQGAIGRMHVLVVGDVIAIIAQGRGIKRQQPESRDPQILQIVQLLCQSWKIADPIAITVVEGPHVEFVDDGVLIPKRIGMGQAWVCHGCSLLLCSASERARRVVQVRAFM